MKVATDARQWLFLQCRGFNISGSLYDVLPTERQTSEKDEDAIVPDIVRPGTLCEVSLFDARTPTRKRTLKNQHTHKWR